MIKLIKLKDVATHSKGKQINGDELIENGVYDYLNGGIKPSGKWNEYNTESDTVTISEGGNSSGYVNFMTNPFWCGAHCYYLYNLKIHPKYLYYALKSQEKRLMSLRTGAAMPNIKKSALSEFAFQIDDNSNNQNQIVSILDSVSNMILKKNQQLSEYEQLIKSRFVEMFGDNGREVPLTDYVWFQEGPGVRSVDFRNEGCILLTGSNINDNKITFGYKSDRFISYELAEGKYSHFICDKNDILVVTSAIAPDKFDSKVVVIDNEDKYCLNTGIIRFKPNKEYLTIGYFREFLKSMYFKSQVMREMTGIAQMHFGPSHLKKMNILLPNDLKIQKEFDLFVEQVDKLKFDLQKHNELLAELLNKKMDEYFGGDM